MTKQQLTQAELTKFNEETKFISDCLEILHSYTRTIQPLFQQIHTEMSSFQSKLESLSKPKGTIKPFQMRMMDSLKVFSETQQHISEAFYDIQQSITSVNQSITDLSEVYINPLKQTLQKAGPQSRWNIWSWWSQPQQDYADSVKMTLTLSLCNWEFKLRVGETMETFYRTFKDCRTVANGDEEFEKTMVTTRLEKAKYLIKYRKNDGSMSYKGKSISQILDMEGRKTSIPSGIENIIKILKTKGYNTDGLFRLSANAQFVNDVYDGLGMIDFEGFDYILLSVVLKKFFQCLPEKLFNRKFTQKAIELNPYSRMYNAYTLSNYVNTLPIDTRNMVKELFGLLYKVNACSEENRMDSNNLAIVWVVNLFEVDQADAMQMMKTIEQLKPFFCSLIEHYMEIFPENSDQKALRLSMSRNSFHSKTNSRSQSEYTKSMANLDGIDKFLK